jgi:hypothetical protein
MFILTSYGEAPQRRLRLLAGDSETNRAPSYFPLRLQPDLDQTAFGFGLLAREAAEAVTTTGAGLGSRALNMWMIDRKGGATDNCEA